MDRIAAQFLQTILREQGPSLESMVRRGSVKQVGGRQPWKSVCRCLWLYDINQCKPGRVFPHSGETSKALNKTNC